MCAHRGKLQKSVQKHSFCGLEKCKRQFSQEKRDGSSFWTTRETHFLRTRPWGSSSTSPCYLTMGRYFWLALFSYEACHGIEMRKLNKAIETNIQLNLSPHAEISFTRIVMTDHSTPAWTLNMLRNSCFILHVPHSCRQFFQCIYVLRSEGTQMKKIRFLTSRGL